jgi:signal-transduction protein with cAMP-binding, CBS, and nucleotidyltransferase domain
MDIVSYRNELLGNNSNIFNSDYSISILANNVAVINANKHDVVLNFGDEISMMILLLEGKFSVYMSWADAKLVKVYEINPGDLCSVAYVNGLKKSPSDYKVIADEDVKFALVPMDFVEKTVNEYKELRSHFFNDIQAKQRTIMHSIYDYTKQLLSEKN